MDAILGFLNDPTVLGICGIAWGLLVKYHPAWKNVPNGIIPYGAALMTFLVKVFGPAPAQAAIIPAAALTVGAAALAAGWQAILNSLIYEVFLRHPIGA